jgi:hypothetical protein
MLKNFANEIIFFDKLRYVLHHFLPACTNDKYSYFC